MDSRPRIPRQRVDSSDSYMSGVYYRRSAHDRAAGKSKSRQRLREIVFLILVGVIVASAITIGVIEAYPR